MERFVKGDVVVVAFPFSNLEETKRRPALILATPTPDDVILCAITSKQYRHAYDIPLTKKDFVTGALKHTSTIRVHRLFTADKKLLRYTVGTLTTKKMCQIEQAITKLFTKRALS